MKITLGLIIGAAVLTLLFSWYAGFFSAVVISEKDFGPLNLVYQEHRGEYSKVGPTMDEVYDKLQADDIAVSRGLGIYYDDPKTTAEVDLRSEVGAIIEEADLAKFEFVKDKYLFKTIAEQKFVIAEFPYRTKTSIIAGVMKVYPKLEEYIASKGYASASIIEIYDLPGKKIYYLMPINGELATIEPEIAPTDYEISEVLDTTCTTETADNDCEIPADYLLKSDCPYEIRCLEEKCTVVCPTPEPELIGGQRDEHGCLGPAGYAWNEEIEACVRSWEVSEADQIKAAQIAVEEFGPVEGLTVISIETMKCSGCFEVTLQQDTERHLLKLTDWEVTDQTVLE